MELQFTLEEYTKYEPDLIIMGFKKYVGSLRSEDFYLAKTIHKTEPDEDGQTRADLLLFIRVSDFSKYPTYSHSKFIHIQPEIMISRTIKERIDLIVDDNICRSIHDLEQFAIKFYDFIVENVKINKQL